MIQRGPNRRILLIVSTVTTAAVVGALAVATPQFAYAEPWSLEQVVRYASEHPPEVKAAQARIQASTAQLGQAEASLWPQIGVQAGYIRTDNPVTVFGSVLNQRAYNQSLNFNDVPDVDNATAKGVVSYSLFSGGKDTAQISAASAARDASEWDAAAVQKELAYQAAVAFFQIGKARDFIRALEASVSSYEANEKAAKAGVQAGTLLKTELLDVQVQLATAREDLIRATNGLALARAALKSLLVIEAPDFDVAPATGEVAAAPTTDLAERPEIKSAKFREDAASSQLRAAEAGYLPRVGLQGSYEYDKGWKLEGDGGSYFAGVIAEWDLFNGKLTARRVDEAKAGLDAAREGARRAKAASSLAEEQARLAYSDATERLRVATQAAELAGESADLSRLRFQQGLSTAVQLIQAETALTAAKVRVAECLAEQRIAAAAVRRALGLLPVDTSREDTNV